jgi:hypothetical protein
MVSAERQKKAQVWQTRIFKHAYRNSIGLAALISPFRHSKILLLLGSCVGLGNSIVA